MCSTLYYLPIEMVTDSCVFCVYTCVSLVMGILCSKFHLIFIISRPIISDVQQRNMKTFTKYQRRTTKRKRRITKKWDGSSFVDRSHSSLLTKYLLFIRFKYDEWKYSLSTFFRLPSIQFTFSVFFFHPSVQYTRTKVNWERSEQSFVWFYIQSTCIIYIKQYHIWITCVVRFTQMV